VVFGETLRWHLCLSNCGNELPWKRSRSSASPVSHSSGDPPVQGSEKTTLAGLPPVAGKCSVSPALEGGVKGHNRKGKYHTGKPRPLERAASLIA
jgi:hypothetical protein